MGILPKLLLITITLLLTTHTLQIPPQSPTASPPTPSLQFSNYTDTDVTAQMSKTYLEQINLAYTFYSQDISNNSLWIQSRLEAKYNRKFNVIILREVTIGGIAAFKWFYVVWVGVNRKEPNWVYVIYASWSYAKSISSVYINSFIAGSGIDDAKQAVIRNVIKNEQDNTPAPYICDSNFISRMAYDMGLYDHQDWGIIVKPITPNRINARIYNPNNQYYSLKTERCEYLIYVTGLG